MKSHPLTNDRDVQNMTLALKRAAKSARKLSAQTGTPFYVWKNGKIVNLNPKGRIRKPRRRLESW